MYQQVAGLSDEQVAEVPVEKLQEYAPCDPSSSTSKRSGPCVAFGHPTVGYREARIKFNNGVDPSGAGSIGDECVRGWINYTSPGRKWHGKARIECVRGCRRKFPKEKQARYRHD